MVKITVYYGVPGSETSHPDMPSVINELNNRGFTGPLKTEDKYGNVVGLTNIDNSKICWIIYSAQGPIKSGFPPNVAEVWMDPIVVHNQDVFVDDKGHQWVADQDYRHWDWTDAKIGGGYCGNGDDRYNHPVKKCDRCYLYLHRK